MAKTNKEFFNTEKYRSIVGSVTANDDLLTQSLSAVGNIYVHGTVDGRDIAADGLLVDSIYTSVTDTSANWDVVYSNVAASSAKRDSVYTSVTDTSANWDVVYSNVAASSASRDSVYSWVNSDSGNNNTNYNQTHFVNASGDIMTGNLSIQGDLSATGDVYLNHDSLIFSDIDGVYANETLTRQNVLNAKSVYTAASTTSGNWDAAYTSVSTSTGDWNAVQPLVHSLPRGSWMIDNQPGTFSTFSSTVSAASGAQTQPITITADVATVAGDVTLTFSGTQAVSSVVATHNSSNDPNLTVTTGGEQIPSVDPSGNIILTGGESQRNFLSMQQDNFAGDHPYSTIKFPHAYVLPYYTTVKKVILRTSVPADAVNIGIHTNEGETTGKNVKFFNETPIANTDNPIQANKSTSYTFTSTATANEGSTLGVSISSTDKLYTVNASIVLEYDTTKDILTSGLGGTPGGWDEFVITIRDTRANILARTGDPVGTIAWATDTYDIFIYNTEGFDQWSSYEDN